jgi:sterol O-acyltransferase
VSTLFKRRKALQKKLSEVSNIVPVSSPSATVSDHLTHAQSFTSASELRNRTKASTTTHIHEEVSVIAKAIEKGAKLDVDQIKAFRELLQSEIDSLDQDLAGKSSSQNVEKYSYPKNLNINNFTDYIFLPTLVYELEYPRQEKIHWTYVAEKTVATFGVIGCMIAVSQAYIYPVVVRTIEMKEQGWTVQERLTEFPWILLDMLFPMMTEYLLSWYVIWECVVSHSSS